MLDYTYILKEASGKLKDTVKFLQDNKNVWNEMRDLKLHDASYYSCTEMEKDFPLCYKNDSNDEYGYFYQFCEWMYEGFKEFCEENKIDFDSIKNQVGRTSKFYLTDLNYNSLEGVICNLYDNVWGGYYGYTSFEVFDFANEEFDKEFNVYIGEDSELDDIAVQSELEYICTELYSDTVAYLHDVIMVAEYIDNAKKHQVEDFKYFLENEEQNLEYERKQEEEILTDNWNKITEIKEKYHITEFDMEKLEKSYRIVL